MSSAGDIYQWFKNGIVLTGAASKDYKPLEMGQYTVSITESGCQSPQSDAYSFVVTAMEPPGPKGLADVYPNPASGQITIQSNTNASGFAQIFNIHGREIVKTGRFTGTHTLSFEKPVSPGLYVIRVNLENGMQSRHKILIK